jgi:hypothetical protein
MFQASGSWKQKPRSITRTARRRAADWVLGHTRAEYAQPGALDSQQRRGFGRGGIRSRACCKGASEERLSRPGVCHCQPAQRPRSTEPSSRESSSSARIPEIGSSGNESSLSRPITSALIRFSEWAAPVKPGGSDASSLQVCKWGSDHKIRSATIRMFKNTPPHQRPMALNLDSMDYSGLVKRRDTEFYKTACRETRELDGVVLRQLIKRIALSSSVTTHAIASGRPPTDRLDAFGEWLWKCAAFWFSAFSKGAITLAPLHATGLSAYWSDPGSWDRSGIGHDSIRSRFLICCQQRLMRRLVRRVSIPGVRLTSSLV